MKELNKKELQHRYIRISIKQADVLQLIGNWKRSETIITNCLKFSKKINNNKLNSEINIILGRIYFKKGDYNQLKKLTDILKKRKGLDSLTKIHLFRNIALLHFKNAEYYIAEKYYLKCLKISLKEQINEEIILAYNNLAIIEFYNYDHIKSLSYINKMKKYSNKKKYIANVYKLMGQIFKSKNKYKLSKEYFKKELKIEKKIGNKFEINNCIANIGIIEKNLGNYDNALKWYEQCLTSAKELGDKQGIASILLNLGNIYRDKGYYLKAQKKYRESIELHEKLKDIRGISISIGNMGLLLLMKKKFKEAIKYLNKALLYDKKGKLKSLKLTHLNYKVLCLLNLEKYIIAKKTNNEVLRLSRELNQKDIIIQTQILTQKINFYFMINSKKKYQIIEILNPILKLTKMEHFKSDLIVAELNFEIFKMLKKINKSFTFYET